MSRQLVRFGLVCGWPARFQCRRGWSSSPLRGDNGTVYFTGYIAATPMPEFAGLAMEGPRYRYVVEAVSDEILLDQALMAPVKGASGMAAGALMTNWPGTRDPRSEHFRIDPCVRR